MGNREILNKKLKEINDTGFITINIFARTRLTDTLQGDSKQFYYHQYFR